MSDVDLAFDALDTGWSLRPAQRQLLTELDETRPRLALVEAPTGIGKSPMALAYGNLVGADKTCILTATISLQHQYERDFDVAVMKGRGNYICDDNGLSAAEGTCRLRKGFRCGSDYYAMREMCKLHPRVVSNYALYLNELWWAGPPFRPRLLVCDEGHRLLDLLTEFETKVLDAKLATECGFDVKGWDNREEAEDWIDHHEEDIKDVLMDAISGGQGKRAKKLTALVRQCDAFDESPESDLVLRTGEEIALSPLWPYASARRLFKSADRLLLMSATMYGGHFLAKLLGLDTLVDNDGSPVDYEYHTVASPFRPERWPVYFRPAGSPSFKKPEEWAKISEAVHEYVHQYHQVKGVIHVSATNQVDKVLDATRRCLDCDHRVIAPGQRGDRSGSTGREAVGKSRADLLRDFRESPPGTWLCHYSVGEGEDFKDDDARIQLIAKVPYPDLSDKLTSLRRDEPGIGNQMYAAMTAGKVAQMAGRGMRHEKDFCETIILDGNFGRLWKWNRDLFPTWFSGILRMEG